MKTSIAGNLAANQSIILSGPGAVKVTAAKSVSISSSIATNAGLSQLSSGVAKAGAILHPLGPLFGFVVLTAGAFLLVRQWSKKVDSGECQ